MSKYSDLILSLRTCSDKSQSDLAILSEDIAPSTPMLERFEITYEVRAEGIYIDLSRQKIKIFKTKMSAVKYIAEGDFLLDIIIVEPDNNVNNLGGFIEFEARSLPQSKCYFFDNMNFFFKFKRLFLEKEIASYNDEGINRLIFLSAKHGRLDVACRNNWNDKYYNSENEIKVQYHTLESKMIFCNEFGEFFKESFIDFAKSIPNENDRYLECLGNIKYIIESARRDYELYRHNFSFSEFKKDFNEEKEKYFKDYQSNLSDFLSKISSMPIQFGAYVYLIFNFRQNAVPLIITTLLILSWSIFKVISVNQIINNVGFLKKRFYDKFEEILSKSGLNKSDINKERVEIERQFDKSLFLIRSYNVFVMVFTACALSFCLHFIGRLLCPYYG